MYCEHIFMYKENTSIHVRVKACVYETLCACPVHTLARTHIRQIVSHIAHILIHLASCSFNPFGFEIGIARDSRHENLTWHKNESFTQHSERVDVCLCLNLRMRATAAAVAKTTMWFRESIIRIVFNGNLCFVWVGSSSLVVRQMFSITHSSVHTNMPMCQKRQCHFSVFHHHSSWEMETQSKSQKQQQQIRHRREHKHAMCVFECASCNCCTQFYYCCDRLMCDESGQFSTELAFTPRTEPKHKRRAHFARLCILYIGHRAWFQPH